MTPGKGKKRKVHEKAEKERCGRRGEREKILPYKSHKKERVQNQRVLPLLLKTTTTRKRSRRPTDRGAKRVMGRPF